MGYCGSGSEVMQTMIALSSKPLTSARPVENTTMMADHDRQILDQFAARVRDQYPDADIRAFGSRARGDATWESDLDVCVVVDHLNNEDRYTLWNIAWEIGFDQDMLISAVPFSKDEFEYGPCSESPLVLNILREGIPA